MYLSHPFLEEARDIRPPFVDLRPDYVIPLVNPQSNARSLGPEASSFHRHHASYLTPTLPFASTKRILKSEYLGMILGVRW